MVEQYAPLGKIWFCMMCGKTTKDCHSEEHGWDESCVLNCILVDEATKRPTESQAQEFAQEHKRQLAAIKSDIARLIQEMQDGTPRNIDPEMMKLARAAVNAVDRREAKAKKKEKKKVVISMLPAGSAMYNRPRSNK